MTTEALKYVWEGAIPLQIHLHISEVTTLPPPPPVLILAPRIGFLPLLVPRVKPLFKDTLPPGADTVWFDYKGLPLKWYIPTGVLFDLLCAEPERPWNLTVHFRRYPGNILIPCDGEDNVKCSFINSLKEANFIISGNCKSVMNMSQSDQVELWDSVLNGNLDPYIRITSKLGLEAYVECKAGSVSSNPLQQGRIPVRLYIRNIFQESDNVEDAPPLDTWDHVSYINKPVELFSKEDGECLTLGDAIKFLVPGFFGGEEEEEEEEVEAKIKLIRIQGIEPELPLPFSWVVKNLKNPDHFLHISIYLIHFKPLLPPPP